MSRAACLAIRKQLQACRRKRRYWRIAKALREAARVSKIVGIPLHVYHCLICSGWHLTKKPQRF